MSSDLARRSVNAVKWNVIGNGTQIVLGFIHAAMLAQLLPVDIFGVYTAALSVVMLMSTFANWGTDGAFIHRAPETEDLNQTAAIHFTMKCGFTAIWTVIMLAAALLLVPAAQSAAVKQALLDAGPAAAHALPP